MSDSRLKPMASGDTNGPENTGSAGNNDPRRSDILLTHGYFLEEDPAERKIMKPYPPLGILCLSAYLKQQGYCVDVFDSTFSSFEAFQEHVHRTKPPAVGIYGNLMTRKSVLRMIGFLKQSEITVILGGPEAAYYSGEFIEAGTDYVIRGEGEQPLADLLAILNDNDPGKSLCSVKGLVYKNKKGEITETPPSPHWNNLDTLPFPDREAIHIEAYISTWKKHHGIGAVSLITARGCPFSCTWCSRAVFGETYRRRSPGLVADEVAFLIERYQPEMLWFADDVFTLNHRWLFDLRDEFQNRGIHIPFECTSRADRMNEKVIRTLAEMGCIRIWYGSESGSQRILNAMGREVTIEKIQKVTSQIRHFGMESGLFVMFGYEGEEISDIDATLEHLKQANPDHYLTTIAYPIKGTPYYHLVKNHIQSDRPWRQRTERDLKLQNRPSKWFYTCTQSWFTNEMRLHRHLSASLRQRFPCYLKAKAARIGMKLIP